MVSALLWVIAIGVDFATKPVKSATAFSKTFGAARGLWSAVWDQAQFARRTGHRAYHHLCTRCTVRVRMFFVRVRMFFLAAAAAGVSYFFRGSSSKARFCTDVKEGMNRAYNAPGLCKATAALMRLPAVPADLDRLISSGRLIHVALYRPHLCNSFSLWYELGGLLHLCYVPDTLQPVSSKLSTARLVFHADKYRSRIHWKPWPTALAVVFRSSAQG